MAILRALLHVEDCTAPHVIVDDAVHQAVQLVALTNKFASHGVDLRGWNPVGGGLLYVQPVYVRATANSSSYPLLQKVLVSFGDQIGFDDTLKGALDQVFGGNSGTTVSTTGVTTTTPQPQQSSTVKAALADAQKALQEANSALKSGDFAAYGKAQDRLKSAINAAIKAQQAGK